MTEHPSAPFIDLPLRMELARRKVGLRQVEMAERVGVSKRTVVNYEHGYTQPKPSIIEAWAQVTNVPLMWLAYGITEQAREEAPATP